VDRLSSTYRNRSVFVTGHTGFKGSWLSLWLGLLGARVTGYALPPPTTPSLFEAADVRADLAEHVEADIRDGPSLASALRRSQPDIVLHLAAQSVVRTSYQQPLETFEVNVQGTAVLLDAIRAVGRPCAVVVVSSDKCYANDESGRPFHEHDPLGGRDPYSASKAGTELVAASWRQSFFPIERFAEHGVALATARAGNVLGGGDWTPDGVVADTFRALSDGRPVALRNPTAVRPWQHVLEPLSGYLELGARLLEPGGAAAFGDAWNFGPEPEDDATVREVIERFLAAFGDGRWEDASDASQPHEAHVLRLATDRARTRLGWRPRWRLDEAVARTAAWYRAYRDDPTKARAATLADLQAYARQA
jgi:CDP-glucose 4,6-dehydratase